MLYVRELSGSLKTKNNTNRPRSNARNVLFSDRDFSIKYIVPRIETSSQDYSERKFFMDYNEFSFEALFKCEDFCFCDSPELEASNKEFDKILKNKITDRDIYRDVEFASGKHILYAQRSGFEQGFRFAVKLMRRVYDMSFPEIPPLL